MRVQVQCVSGMPHNVGIWFDQRPDKTVLYVDASLIPQIQARIVTERGTMYLKAAAPDAGM